MTKFRFLAIVVTGIAAVFLFIAVYSIFIVVSDEPLVISSKKSNPQSLLSLKKGIKQAVQTLNSSKPQKLISIKHTEVDELLAILSKSVPSVSAKYNHSNLQLLIALSIKLPSNPVGKYINISTEFTDNNNLLAGHTRIGEVLLDNDLAFGFAFFVASLILDDDLITLSKRLLSNVSYSQKDISLSIDEDIDTNLLIDRIKQDLKKYSNLAWSSSQFTGVAHYYHQLLAFSEYTRGIDKVSVFDYLKPLYIEAKTLSLADKAVDENTSALLAFGLFAGDYKLRRFLSHVTGIELNDQVLLPKVVLANRQDLMLHFLYSSIIPILSSKNLSLSIGELKEISDMESGGSGFSFADLAADRAGIQFITMATDNNGGAEHLQTFLARAESEQGFFPDIFGLEEQISLSKFDINYRDTDSEEYKIIIDEIDRRIRLLPLYASYYRP